MKNSPEPSRRLVSARENLRKAWAALKRVNYQTPRRLAASRANVRKAQEANTGHYRLTPRRLAANLANVKKMWAAPKPPYRATERRLAAARANLSKAWAANRGHYRRTPGRLEAIRGNALRHGFYSVSLEDTLTRLREDPKEFEAHVQLIVRVFSPRDEMEQRIVRRLAEAIWLHLRLYRAQARQQADALKHYLSLAHEVSPLSPDLTLARGYSLQMLLLDQGPFQNLWLKILGRVERSLDVLVRKRTAGGRQFPSVARRIGKSMRESERREAREEMLERVLEGGPEGQEILAQVEENLKGGPAQA